MQVWVQGGAEAGGKSQTSLITANRGQRGLAGVGGKPGRGVRAEPADARDGSRDAVAFKLHHTPWGQRSLPTGTLRLDSDCFQGDSVEDNAWKRIAAICFCGP